MMFHFIGFKNRTGGSISIWSYESSSMFVEGSNILTLYIRPGKSDNVKI